MTETPDLKALWRTGVAAVSGDRSVSASLTAQPIRPPHRILSVGKAAGAMASAALSHFPGTPCLVVTKHDHPGAAGADLIEAGHPVPDANSLKAGEALQTQIADCQPGDHLLMLISGGASALAEALPAGMSLSDFAGQTQEMLASGADIHAMNARRKEISQIKGGKLFATFAGDHITTLAISDVEGDALDVVGSGLGAAPTDRSYTVDQRIVASNAIARRSIADNAPCEVIENSEILYENVSTLALKIARRLLDGRPGLYIFGGEPTVSLPPAPGLGGRNMALGLALSEHIKGNEIAAIIAGTDGTDGPTDAAGAIVDGATWSESGAAALAAADAYPWLAARNALFKTGPTGTNVMDVLLAFKAR